MAIKNLGQVSGVHIGNTPPQNIILIWYDDTPNQYIHKVFDVNLNQWVVLDKNTISTITYSEIINLATTVGLSVGAWFKISDKSNALALAITTTKVQYNDSVGNILIDDLGTNVQYHVTSSNLSIDEIVGVFDNVNKKLVFQFNETVPDYTADDYVLGKIKRNNVWSLAKYKLSSFLSTVTGNSITWNGGFFFNFNKSVQDILDTQGGIVSKDAHDSDIQNLNTAVNNVGQQNQSIIDNASQAIIDATTPTEIYNKVLPNDLVTSGSAINLAKGDSLYNIISKVQRWINQFKLATGIRISPNFTQATSEQFINSNDTVETAFGKVQYWFRNISMKLSVLFQPYDYTGTVDALAPADSLEEAFRKVQGKLNQIGDISNGKIESKNLISGETVPVTTLDLKNGNASFYDALDIDKRCKIDALIPHFEARNDKGYSSLSGDGIISNVAGKNLYPGSAGINHGASIVGLGYGSVEMDVANKSFVAGVAGLATNSNETPAPAYGGYFDKLKINGMYLNVKIINTNYNMTSLDALVTCYNAGAIVVALPIFPYIGHCIYIHQVNSQVITINAGSLSILKPGGTEDTSHTTEAGDIGKTFKLIWDRQYWLMNIL